MQCGLEYNYTFNDPPDRLHLLEIVPPTKLVFHRKTLALGSLEHSQRPIHLDVVLRLVPFDRYP